MSFPLCKNPANNHLQRLLFIASLVMTFITLNLFQYSCKRYDIEKELKQADSLIILANSSLKTMVVDAALVRSRIDSMQMKIDFLNALDTGRMSQEFRVDISSYNALFVNYRNFVTQYEALDFDSRKYLQKAESMKKDLIDKKNGKDDFRLMYADMTAELNYHNRQCKQLVQDILSTELMYQRLNTKITGFYDKNLDERM
jgi:hypothetical protein